jgi:hypothetical protein
MSLLSILSITSYLQTNEHKHSLGTDIQNHNTFSEHAWDGVLQGDLNMFRMRFLRVDKR